MADQAPTGGLLRAYLAATAWAAPLAERHLQRRLARGKENPDRWREKLGEASSPRPDGPLVWMHAVGLGEVLALRGLIEEMQGARADLQFLVTSSARASGEVFDRNRPPRTVHQYLPLDAGRFVTVPGPLAPGPVGLGGTGSVAAVRGGKPCAGHSAGNDQCADE